MRWHQHQCFTFLLTLARGSAALTAGDIHSPSWTSRRRAPLPTRGCARLCISAAAKLLRQLSSGLTSRSTREPAWLRCEIWKRAAAAATGTADAAAADANVSARRRQPPPPSAAWIEWRELCLAHAAQLADAHQQLLAREGDGGSASTFAVGAASTANADARRALLRELHAHCERRAQVVLRLLSGNTIGPSASLRAAAPASMGAVLRLVVAVAASVLTFDDVAELAATRLELMHALASALRSVRAELFAAPASPTASDAGAAAFGGASGGSGGGQSLALLAEIGELLSAMHARLRDLQNEAAERAMRAEDDEDDEDDYEDEEEHRSKRARGGRSYGGPFPPLDSEERASLRAVLLECGTLAAVLAGAGGEVSDASPAAGVRSSGTPPLSLRALELCLPDVSLPDALPSTDDDLVGASAASAAPLPVRTPHALPSSAITQRHPFVLRRAAASALYVRAICFARHGLNQATAAAAAAAAVADSKTLASAESSGDGLPILGTSRGGHARLAAREGRSGTARRGGTSRIARHGAAQHAACAVASAKEGPAWLGTLVVVWAHAVAGPRLIGRGGAHRGASEPLDEGAASAASGEAYGGTRSNRAADAAGWRGRAPHSLCSQRHLWCRWGGGAAAAAGAAIRPRERVRHAECRPPRVPWRHARLPRGAQARPSHR